MCEFFLLLDQLSKKCKGGDAVSLIFSRPAASCLGDGSMESTCSRGLDGSLSGLRLCQWHLISQEGDHGVMGPMGQSL